MTSTSREEYDEEVTALFRALGGRLRGFLINMGASPELADEIVNDAFAAVRRHWDRLRAGRPDIYLHKVARNEFRKRERDERTEHRIGHREDIPEIPGAAVVDHLIDRLTLRWALEQLARREREVLLLRHYWGYNVAEAAKIMDIAEGTVKNYTSVGLWKLRKLVDGGTGTGEVGDR